MTNSDKGSSNDLLIQKTLDGGGKKRGMRLRKVDEGIFGASKNRSAIQSAVENKALDFRRRLGRCCSWRCAAFGLLSFFSLLRLLEFFMQKTCFPASEYDQACSLMDDAVGQKMYSSVTGDLAAWKSQTHSVEEMAAFVEHVNSDGLPVRKKLSLIHLQPSGR